MGKSRPKLKILLAEDSSHWQDLIVKELTLEAKRLSLNAEIVTAETTSEAISIAKSHLFHAISLDQNMPRFPGDQRDSKWGRQLMLEIADLELASYICIFTLFPNIDISNDAGSKAAIPYKVKAADTHEDSNGISRMDAVDYCEFFLPEAYQQFIRRAFDRLQNAGFVELSSLAANCHDAYEALYQGQFNRDADANTFFIEFGKFREVFNRSFASLTRGIAASRSLRLDTLSRKSTARNVEVWIEKAWKILEADERFEDIKSGIRNFFGLDSQQSLSEYFISASIELREPRNVSVHEDWTFAPEDFSRLNGAFLRFSEMIAFVATLPLVVQPRIIGGETMSFTNINHARPREQKKPYTGTSIPEVNPTRVFVLLPGVTELLPLDGGIVSKRDSKTNRLVIEEVGLRK